jgi:mRNA-degrading endonuclease RelE of RelBE toxin-antitoxin system
LNDVFHRVHAPGLRRFEGASEKGAKAVVDGIEAQLIDQPTAETRNRKKLRPNNVAEWELRIGRFRVFYNVLDEARIVSIEAVGFKIGNLLFIRSKRTDL